MHNIKKPNLMVSFAAVIILIAGLKAASGIITPLLLAAFLALICSPVVSKLESFKVNRSIASLITVVLLGYLIFIIGDLLAATSKTFFIDMQQAIEVLIAKFSHLSGENGSLIAKQLEAINVGSVLSSGLSLLSTIKSTISFTFIVALTTFLILCEGRQWKEKISSVMGNSSFSKRATSEIHTYMTVKCITSIATGVILAFALWALGHKYWLLWGILATALNFIPNIGSFLAAIPAVIVAFATMDIMYASATLAIYVGVNVAIGSYFEPKIIGDKLGISTLVVFMSMIFSGWMFGMIGMLLSVPIISCIKIVLDEHDPTNPVSILLK